MKKDTKTLVLLDAHAILHRAYHALPDFATSKGEPTGALYGVVTMLLKIMSDLKPDFIIACYDLPQKTYRHEAYAEYKGGRAKADDELVSQIIRSSDIFKAFDIPIYSAPGFEADDVLGTIADKTRTEKNLRVIIASGDMDTLQLIEGERVKVFTLRKGIKDTVIFDEKGVIEKVATYLDVINLKKQSWPERLSNGWHPDTTSEEEKNALIGLCGIYLAKFSVRKGGNAVAKFHLGNGAQLYRINWGGDLSKKGLRQSASLMVNYLYDLDKIEDNHERFVNGEVIYSRLVTKIL